MSNGKFTSSVENKPLRKYSDREQIQGTAPVETSTTASAEPPPVMPAAQPADASANKPSGPIVSPLEEMNRQVPADAEKDKSKSSSKKSVKVAKSK